MAGRMAPARLKVGWATIFSCVLAGWARPGQAKRAAHHAGWSWDPMLWQHVGLTGRGRSPGRFTAFAGRETGPLSLTSWHAGGGRA